MEQLFYKVRLKGGRVIGPLDLARIKLFIYRDKITGLEMARLYPTGDWKDINTFPEIAELLMKKLEGSLELDEGTRAGADAMIAQTPGESDGHTRASVDDPSAVTIENAPSGANPPPLPHAPPPTPRGTQTGTPQLQLPEQSLEIGSLPDTGATPAMHQQQGASEPAAANSDNEATMMITPDNERTMMVPAELDHASDESPNAVKTVDESEVEMTIDPSLAQEKTAMLTFAPPSKEEVAKSKAAEHKKKIMGAVLLVLGAIYLMFADEPEQKGPVIDDETAPIEILMPRTEAKQDPQKSEAIFKKALPVYYQDTVEGYKKASKLLLESIAWDANNVRALCLLASSYMNLIDVVNRDEMYFNTITRLIEMERAKGMDLAETVIADVELYHILGNPDAAFTRIVEFAKLHEWGVDMVYYLALSFYLQNKYPEALQQLDKIDPKDYFSPKIPFLYGQVFEKNGEIDKAINAYNFVINKSPKHVKARVRLAGLYMTKDNLPEAGKHAEYVIKHRTLASQSELSKAYYYRGRMHMVANRDLEAIKDLEKALENAPGDPDILLDFYTLKARHGEKIKDASGLAKMFAFMAQGERSLKDEKVDEALAHFLSAREANDKDPTPLLRIADVFIKKGDLQSANMNLAKALALAPKQKDIFPKYIRTLIQSYEFEEANQVLAKYKETLPDQLLVDRMQGEIYFKQEKYQEANTFLKKALGASNFDSSVYVAYATLMFKTNNFRDSAFYFGLALRFDPFNTDAVIGIGKSLAELESLDKGVEYVQNALANSPHKAALLNGIAEIYVRKGDYASGIKYADNALTTDPKFAPAFKTKGEAYAAQEKRKEALDALLSYTNLAPLDPTGHIKRHEIYLKRDEKGRSDLSAAKAELLKVATSYPHFPGIHFLLGELYQMSNEPQKALEEAEFEIKNNPNYLQAYILAAKLLNASKSYADAIKYVNKVMKVAPNYVPALIEAGVANHGLKSYAAAQSMLERALNIDPGNPIIYKKLGVLYYDLNHYDKMKVSLQKYIEVYPDAPDRPEVEGYLKRIQ